MSSSSYRQSHQQPGHGGQYDALNYGPGCYDEAVWQLEKPLLDRICDRHFPGGIARYLDFACGTGRIVGHLVGRAEVVVGVDISEEMLERARFKVSGVAWQRGDITADPSPLAGERPFDLITAFRFLLNAEPALRERALDALVPLLKPGGLLLVNNHGNSTSLLWLSTLLRRAVRRHRENLLPCRAVMKLLKDRGLEVIEVHPVCYLPPAAGRRLPRWFWVPLEQGLARCPWLRRWAVNQLYVARKPGPSTPRAGEG